MIRTKKINYAAIIQVRSGSKRLPIKSLLDLGSLKTIEWVIKRVKKTSLLDEIILATTKKQEDKIFNKFAKKNKIKIFFGDEKNVLKRFCDAGEKFRVHNIIRICADRPFIDPKFIDKLINFFKKNKCDLAFNHVSNKKLKFKCIDGFGAEVFSLQSLKKIQEKTFNKNDLEHVTKYFYNNKRFKVSPVPVKKLFKRSQISLDLDTKKDFVYLNNLVKKNNFNIFSKSENIVKAAIYESN